MTAQPAPFPGFPPRPQATPLPNVFFSDLLPLLTDPADLAVTLMAFHVLARKKGFPRYITREELAAEPALARFLANAGRDASAIDASLTRTLELGITLRLDVERDGQRVALYFLNAPADRRGVEAVASGAVPVGRLLPAQAAEPSRPGIYALYESFIGTVGPGIAAELTEAERLYPAEWIEAAFREAAAQNARSWRYVSRILERWAIEGPDNHAETERDPAAGRYLGGKYGSILRRRLGR
ncbi:MAG TPA: DnaD domain protein [Dehalococcoidia bacterium]|nr:DnaD domain protein [Dehalococcoidia bacterium]